MFEVMPEIATDFPRAWLEFEDPEFEETIYRCDLTWLTSSWQCIFGNGCKGIEKDKPDYGCCVHGAHFDPKKEKKRVQKYVNKLTPDIWQNYEAGKTKKGWYEKDEDGELKTSVFHNACIFHNRKDFAGGEGCALHSYALKNGIKPQETKPDVCWQLPIRRSYNNRKYEDGVEFQIITIEEYQRRDWGDGGHDMDWYCSSNTEAHTASVPVYLSEKDTLIELMGEASYEILKTHCDARMKAISAIKELPGREAKKVLLSLQLHPASNWE